MAIAIATEWSLFQNCCETVEDDFRSTTIRKAEWQVRSLNLLLSGGRHLTSLGPLDRFARSAGPDCACDARQ